MALQKYEAAAILGRKDVASGAEEVNECEVRVTRHTSHVTRHTSHVTRHTHTAHTDTDTCTGTGVLGHERARARI